ncbi:MAG: restriction endonuclease subunit S [Megasphaera micronuciformis]
MMKKVPKRRFKGFLNAGDWEQRKLKSIANMIVAGGDIDKNKIKESGTYPVIANALSKDGIVGYYDDSYRIEAPAVTVTGRGDIGVAKARHQNFTPVVRLLSLTTAHDVDFVEYAINNLKIVSESTGVPQLTVPQLSNYKIHITSIIEERKIGLFISKLDNLITLHQRKLEKLQATKKALLYELFPIENSRRPKRRFKGFTGDWEQRKLGECMNSFAYGLNAAAKGYDDMHKYIRITDIDDETHNFIQSNLASPDIDFNMDVSHYKLNVGDIVFARTGASVGKTYLYNPNDGDLYYAGFLIRGKVKEDCDAGFIYQNTLTKDYDSFIKITSQRSGQPGVNSKEYATFRLNIPCKDEQEKISKVLNSLDELFTLHQRKLEKLKNLKAAYLNEMFV